MTLENDMNKNIIDLAERSGFAFWGDEDWNPGDVIDWSNSYDEEFNTFAKRLIQEVLQLQKSGTDVLTYFGIEDDNVKESVEIELPDYQIENLMYMAHERDITFNKLVEQAILETISTVEMKNR